MPSVAGRKVLLQMLVGTEYTTIGALKSKTATINNEPIDVTTDDDNGYRAYIEDVSGTRSCDIKADGILKALTVADLADSEAALELRFLVPGVLQIDGTFKISNFEIGAELEDGASFSASFGSSGAFTIATPTP